MSTGATGTTPIPQIKSKKQIDGMQKKEAQEYALQITNLYTDLKEDFLSRLDKLESFMEDNRMLCREIARLNSRVVGLEREVLNRDQYARRRQIELWNVPDTVSKETDNNLLKEKVATILSITETKVEATDIDVVHAMKKEGRIIMELNRRTLRHDVLKTRKNLKNKKTELKNVNCPKLSIVESMAFEYKHLDFICRQLVKRKLLEKSFFFNGKLHVEAAGSHKLITHIMDLINLVGMDVVDEIEGKQK